jgi:hypothetical protein
MSTNQPAPAGSETDSAAAGDRAEESSPLDWRDLLELGSAIAGFALLAYGVGATMLWIRFWSTGFPADLALAAVPRARVAVLGFRTMFGWLVLFGLVAALVWLVERIRMRNGTRNADTASEPTSDTARDAKTAFARLCLPLVVTAAIVVSAFVTWSVFTTVLVLLAGISFVRRYRRREHARGIRAFLPVAGFCAVASAFLSLGWQLQINLPYDQAVVAAKGQPARQAVYFGQVGDSVLVSPREPLPSHRFTRDIIVYRRDDLSLLKFLPEPQTLCTNVARPATALWRTLVEVKETVRQHLRQSGQRPLEPPKPQKPLPIGQCPPQ